MSFVQPDDVSLLTGGGTVACCGIDFGTHASKLCLAYVRQRENGYAELTLLRVSNNAGWGHSERPPNGKLEYDFSSYAVLKDGELRTGRYALYRDIFPLKTMCCKLAGILDEIIQGLPDGPRLLQAHNDYIITDEMIRNALLKHFALVKEMA
jgi:hypothetical protein